ncbi:hypothetical protein OK016_21310 [Vibrio chagasii]|nr:hypothetical protein [Vibrio chagasii]
MSFKRSFCFLGHSSSSGSRLRNGMPQPMTEVMQDLKSQRHDQCTTN